MKVTKRNVRRVLTSVVVAAALGLWASPGFAQDRRKSGRTRAAQPAAPAKPQETKAQEGRPPDEGKAPDVQVEGSGRKRVYRIKTEFVIEGRIQKPNAFYVLQRSNINYAWVDLKHEVVPLILQTVREKPF